ncbi:MAG: c-type cytochrome [Acidobacteria bacterium]|nr:c-type cytochrome [Acidobacteriota bacterium]MBK9706527.1 c-type cytochrome [Acidobacteriota bacterium]
MFIKQTSHKGTVSNSSIKIILSLLLLVTSAASCSSEKSSVLTSTDSANTQAGQQAGAGNQTAVAAPTAIPADPVAQATPSAQGQAAGQPASNQDGQKSRIPDGKLMTDGEFTTAKPAPTPAKDPFPARPTPAVVMQNGKIVQQWQAPADAAAVVSPVKDNPNAAGIGKVLYLQKCVDCHGKAGEGNGWMSKGLLRPPTNLASKVVQANTDGELFWKITNGKSPMPAHRVRFTDEERWYIVSYLRTFKP